ncbi:hypothetical protein MHBO_003324 [Bonamia ostreae]|uniref:E3 ubiquitin-protein ligase n=1 Tax=Bonamia ostreae TaxID=126728 RepID=A0ABV2AQ31_9EUKA
MSNFIKIISNNMDPDENHSALHKWKDQLIETNFTTEPFEILLNCILSLKSKNDGTVEAMNLCWRLLTVQLLIKTIAIQNEKSLFPEKTDSNNYLKLQNLSKWRDFLNSEAKIYETETTKNRTEKEKMFKMSEDRILAQYKAILNKTIKLSIFNALPFIENIAERFIRRTALLFVVLGFINEKDFFLEYKKLENIFKLPSMEKMLQTDFSDILAIFLETKNSQNTFNLNNKLKFDQIFFAVKPSLIRLPKDYNHLFQLAFDAICENCNTNPQKPALCLLCGKVVCVASKCCRTEEKVLFIA